MIGIGSRDLNLVRNCCNCGKPANKMPGGRLLTCSACQQVDYCSKDCQIAHWKEGHKNLCKQNVRTKQLMDESISPIFTKAFEQWRSVASYFMIPVVYHLIREKYQSAPFQRDSEIQFVTIFELEYNENSISFKVKGEPTCVRISDIPLMLSAPQMEALKQAATQLRYIRERAELAFIVCEAKRAGSITPLNIADDVNLKNLRSYKNVMEALNGIPLKLLVNRLSSYERNRLKTTVQSNVEVLHQSPAFSELVLWALRMQSCNSMHKTHRFLIVCEMSSPGELGKIRSLVEYKVLSLSEIQSIGKGELSRDRFFMSPEENNPKPEASRKQFPNNVVVPILFQLGRDRPTFFYQPTVIDNAITNNLPQRQCKRLADKAFATLQKFCCSKKVQQG